VIEVPGDRPRSIPEISVDAQILARRLQRCEEDELITYDELSTSIGRDVRSPQARHLLKTALRVALRENQFVFGTVSGQGVKRLRNQDIAPTEGSTLSRRIQNATRRSAQKLRAVDYGALTRQEQVEYNTAIAICGSLSLLTSSQARITIERQTRQQADALPTAQVLSLLAS